MSNVLEFPVDARRSWFLMEPAYRRIISDLGASKKNIDLILVELEGYHLQLSKPTSFGVTLGPELNLTDSQAEGIKEALSAAGSESNQIVQDKLDTAHGIIIDLLIEKYQGSR